MNYLIALVAFVLLSLKSAVVAQSQGIADINMDAATTSVPVAVVPVRANDDDGEQQLAPFCVRLHLIRHGETIANVHNIVLGQGDSPLTDNGVVLAVITAASDKINGKRLRYWRTYCSDLHRAHRTAKIVLGLEDGEGNSIEGSGIDLVVDSRLREIAKGAREGYAKSFSNQEALAMRRREADASARTDLDIDVPVLESIDDAWRRVKDLIDSIVDDASNEYYSTVEQGQHQEDIDSCANGNAPKIYDVFALSHSALIRTMIHKMVGHEISSDFATTKEGSLLIPNLSRTTIDVRPLVSRRSNDNDASSSRWIPSLHRLADVSHLNDATLSGPPCL